MGRINPGLMSSKSDEWTTPRDLFDKLNRRFLFTADAAATSENALCCVYYTDGLSVSWEGERVYCNPPYSQIKAWAAKFIEESKRADCIVALVPARTDTKWFQSLMASADKIVFIKGRLHFSNAGSAPFPSALAIWLGLNEF